MFNFEAELLYFLEKRISSLRDVLNDTEPSSEYYKRNEKRLDMLETLLDILDDSNDKPNG